MSLALVRRPKSPYWIIRGTIAGIRIEESTGCDKKADARRVLQTRHAQILERHLDGPLGVASFAEAVLLYLEKGGEARFLDPILEQIGTMQLREIDQEQVERLARTLYPGATPATVNRQVFTPISAVMRVAASANLAPLRTFTRPKVTRKPVEIPPEDWLEKVVGAASPHLGALLIFLSFTGARISEACRLDWTDVDLRRRTALLRRTKNGKPRRVPLARLVVVAMGNLEGERQGRVFSYAGRSSVYGALRRACKRAGVDYYATHAAGRHSFAARLLGQGYTLKLMQDAAGLESYQLAANTYGHLEQSMVDDAVRDAGENWGKEKPKPAKALKKNA